MATAPLTLELNVEAVRAYNTASEEEQKKMRLLLSLWLKELGTSPAVSLRSLMDDISDKAQARGLTPAILESILDAD
ncbi:MAG: hypothetical protein HS114_31935 [Anaerolineales bacterium]|nr:hypothetical protein [Anaerolineales bacterium]